MTRAGEDAPSGGRGSGCSGFGRATHRIPPGRASPRRWREGTPSAANDRIGSGDFFHDRGKGTRERRRVRGRDPSSLKALLETIVGTAAGGGGVSGRVVTTRRVRDRRRGYRAPDPRGTRPPRAPRGACARRSRRTPSLRLSLVFPSDAENEVAVSFPKPRGAERSRRASARSNARASRARRGTNERDREARARGGEERRERQGAATPRRVRL